MCIDFRLVNMNRFGREARAVEERDGRQRDEGEQAENRVPIYGEERARERSGNARCQIEQSPTVELPWFHSAEW